jgi:hypothetical protein
MYPKSRGFLYRCGSYWHVTSSRESAPAAAGRPRRAAAVPAAADRPAAAASAARPAPAAVRPGGPGCAAGRGVTNLADDAGFTRDLARELGGHIDRFARTMPREAAVAWVYMTVLVAWAEDHELIAPWLRAGGAAAREQFLAVPAGGMRGWLARAMASLAVHPGTWSLLDPKWTPLRAGTPAEGACRDLVTWWAADAPSLAYDVSGGPGSGTGWIPGDLLQHLSAERRKTYALVQTPWWVCDFILDRTLIPAAAEFTGQTLRLIDPACGTGHFIVRAISYLWDWYTEGYLAPRQAAGGASASGTALPPAEAARRILAGVHGCDRDPLTAAVARFRYTTTLAGLMHQAGLIPGPLRLDRIPRFQVPVIPGDSLLARTDGFSAADYARLHPRLAAIINLGADGPGAPAVAVLTDPEVLCGTARRG